MLQIEIMKWQGLTACNGSLCSSVPAQGSMPLRNDSKGWNRSPREALEFPAWGWGGDKQTSVRMALVHWSCLWFWEDTTSCLEVPSSLCFPMLNLKPCNLPSDCDNKWDFSSSLSECWTAVLSSTHFSPSEHYCLSLVCQLPHSWPGVLPNCDTFPVTLIPQKICCIFHAFFSFIEEAFVKLKFLQHGTKEQIFKALSSASNGISEAVRLEKLPYTKGLPSPVSFFMPKTGTWRK